MDRFNKQLVCYITDVYNPKGTPASDRFQREVIARLTMILGQAKLAMVKPTGAPDNGTHHAEMSAWVDIRRLIERLQSENVYYS